MKDSTCLILSVVMLLSASAVYAHLEGGVDAKNGNYIFDIGYDVANLTAPRSTVFLVDLNDLNGSQVPTTSMWVRISDAHGQNIFIAKILPEPTGSYSFTTFLPREGEYTMKARFAAASGEIDTAATLLVSREPGSYKKIWVAVITAILIVTTFIIFKKDLSIRKNRRR